MEGTILVIRDDARFCSILREAGFAVRSFPLIKTVPLTDLSRLRKSLDKLRDYDGVFLTSSEAAKILVREGASALSSYRGKFYVLGDRSRNVLEAAGLSAVNAPPAN